MVEPISLNSLARYHARRVARCRPGSDRRCTRSGSAGSGAGALSGQERRIDRAAQATRHPARRGAPGRRQRHQSSQGRGPDGDRRPQDRVLEQAALAARLAAERIDVTLPGRGQTPGGLHPVTRTLRRIERLFANAGFAVAEGPEVEDSLSQLRGAQHPRASSGAGDARHLLFRRRPPAAHPHLAGADSGHGRAGAAAQDHRPRAGLSLRLRPDPHPDVPSGRRAAGGRAGQLRRPQGRALRLSDAIFSSATCKLRFRPSYFPFTEPSAEVDIQCVMCGGAGCRVCKQTGWLEVLGCGMVYPECFRHVGIDPERYLRLCLRHGRRAAGDAALRHRRYSPLFRE